MQEPGIFELILEFVNRLLGTDLLNGLQWPVQLHVVAGSSQSIFTAWHWCVAISACPARLGVEFCFHDV